MYLCIFHQCTMGVTEVSKIILYFKKPYPDILRFGQIVTSMVGNYIANLCLHIYINVRSLLQWLEIIL